MIEVTSIEDFIHIVKHATPQFNAVFKNEITVEVNIMGTVAIVKQQQRNYTARYPRGTEVDVVCYHATGNYDEELKAAGIVIIHATKI